MDKSRDVDIPLALAAGAAGGTAYLASAWLDSKLSSHPFNDVKLVGQIFTTNSPVWQLQGLVGHYGFAGVVTLLYASMIQRRLPGPGWLRGLIFLQIENSLLYPLAPFMDKRHAGVRSGQIPPVWKWKTFWGQVVRHIAFGVVMGAVYGAGRD